MAWIVYIGVEQLAHCISSKMDHVVRTIRDSPWYTVKVVANSAVCAALTAGYHVAYAPPLRTKLADTLCNAANQVSLYKCTIQNTNTFTEQWWVDVNSALRSPVTWFPYTGGAYHGSLLLYENWHNAAGAWIDIFEAISSAAYEHRVALLPLVLFLIIQTLKRLAGLCYNSRGPAHNATHGRLDGTAPTQRSTARQSHMDEQLARLLEIARLEAIKIVDKVLDTYKVNTKA